MGKMVFFFSFQWSVYDRKLQLLCQKKRAHAKNTYIHKKNRWNKNKTPKKNKQTNIHKITVSTNTGFN
jgi:hypothetical protein